MATKSKTFDNLNITDLAVQSIYYTILCLQKIRKKDNVSEIKRERERDCLRKRVCVTKERERERVNRMTEMSISLRANNFLNLESSTLLF